MRKMPGYRLRLVRDLRQRQTESEQLLWQHLRSGRLDGLKFRRQRSLGRYIADFCCDAAKLVIEIDGGIHEGQDRKEYDRIRDDILTAHNYALLRFSVDDIIQHTSQIVAQIREVAFDRLKNPPSPAREAGKTGRGG